MGSLILNDQGELQETRGAAIESIPRGMGRGGTVTVLARDVIFVSGRDSRGSPSGLFSNTSSRGDARRITISAPSVRLEDGDIITGRALSEGRGGDIALEVGTLTLTGGARIDSGATGAGSGGMVTVSARETVSLSGRNSGLFNDAAGGGRGARSISGPARFSWLIER